MILPQIYTCQHCRKDLEVKRERFIQKYVTPVCSYKCLFNVVYKLLKKYSPDNLKKIQGYFQTNVPENKIHFELTKKILKEVLIHEVHEVQMD